MFGLQCVLVFLLVGSEAICIVERDENFQEFDGDQAEFDFDDLEDGDDQGTYLSDYWCYWRSLHLVLPVDDDSMVVDYGDEDEDLASYYLIIILCVVYQHMYIIVCPCLGGVGDCTLLLGCQVQLCMCTKLARRLLAVRECVARSVWTGL